ncbi:unnamed protein product [Rhodiola kirilowii]
MTIPKLATLLAISGLSARLLGDGGVQPNVSICSYCDPHFRVKCLVVCHIPQSQLALKSENPKNQAPV